MEPNKCVSWEWMAVDDLPQKDMFLPLTNLFKAKGTWDAVLAGSAPRSLPASDGAAERNLLVCWDQQSAPSRCADAFIVFTSAMSDALASGIGPQKRGRPRKYAEAQEKTDAEVKRNRAKRQQATSAQWGKKFTLAYNTCLPSSLPPLPGEDGGRANLPRMIAVLTFNGLRHRQHATSMDPRPPMCWPSASCL